MINLFQDFLNWTGSNNTSGNQYGFWSGFGSDIGEFAIIGSIAVAYRKINCHVEGCRRIGHYQLGGTPYKLCKRHHPDIPDKITHVSILHLHKKTDI